MLVLVHGTVHGGGGGDVWWGWKKCMCVLPGFVWLDLGLVEGLDGDGEEVNGVVSGCETPCTTHALTHARPSLPVNQNPNPAPPNL